MRSVVESIARSSTFKTCLAGLVFTLPGCSRNAKQTDEMAHRAQVVAHDTDCDITAEGTKVRLGGHLLPNNFDAREISAISGLVISGDMKNYAYIEHGRLFVKEMPADRVIISGNFRISLGDTPSISHTGATDGPATIKGKNSLSNGRFSLSSEYLYRAKIDKAFEDAREVENDFASERDFALAVSSDDSVHVTGQIARDPTLRGGKLILTDFTGVVSIPRTIGRIKLAGGSIEGEIASAGEIDCKDLNVRLKAPLRVEIERWPDEGKIDVVGMSKDPESTSSKLIYSPSDETPVGTLTLKNFVNNLDHVKIVYE